MIYEDNFLQNPNMIRESILFTRKFNLANIRLFVKQGQKFLHSFF